MVNRDIISGLAWVTVGIVFCAGALGYRVGDPANPGMGFFPFIVGCALVILALIVFFQGWQRRGEDRKAGKPIASFKGRNKIVMATMGLFMYIFGFEYLGFVLITFLFMAYLMIFVERQRWMTLIAVSILTATISYSVFVYLLKVELPKGLLTF
jgi:putative tricarboxylic transport membrane protein